MQVKIAFSALPDMPAMAPRRRWVAAIASLVLPGFGQFYNGDFNRAIWLFLGFALLCIPAIALIALYLPAGLMMPSLALGSSAALGVWAYSVWDAWRGAGKDCGLAVKVAQMSGCLRPDFCAV